MDKTSRVLVTLQNQWLKEHLVSGKMWCMAAQNFMCVCVCVARGTCRVLAPGKTECVPVCREFCMCSGEVECKVCCSDTGSCAPSNETINLANGSLCSEGVCVNVSVSTNARSLALCHRRCPLMIVSLRGVVSLRLVIHS